MQRKLTSDEDMAQAATGLKQWFGCALVLWNESSQTTLATDDFFTESANMTITEMRNKYQFLIKENELSHKGVCVVEVFDKDGKFVKRV
jgi:hypothetical protein